VRLCEPSGTELELTIRGFAAAKHGETSMNEEQMMSAEEVAVEILKRFRKENVILS